jgi:hypothetical protein
MHEVSGHDRVRSDNLFSLMRTYAEVSMRLSRGAVCAAILVVTLAGCTGSGPAPKPHHQALPACATRKPRAVPDSYLDGAVISTADFLRVIRGAVRPSPNKAILIGPHSALQLDAVATTASIDGSAACALGLSGPLSAPSGHQLVLAHFSDNPSYPSGLPECGYNNPPAACQDYRSPTIVVGASSNALPDGDTAIVSVPKGTAAALQMNDGGRPQNINLRTGERIREASPLYYPVLGEDLSSVSMSSEWNTAKTPGLHFMAGDNFGVELSGDSYGNTLALLAPYDDASGWAPSGSAWLLVSLSISTDANFGFTANVPRSFTLTLPSGAAVAASGTAFYKAGSGNGPAIASLAFRVPVTSRTGTLRFTPAGTLYPGDGLSPIPVGATGLMPGNNKLTIKLSAQPGSS